MPAPRSADRGAGALALVAVVAAGIVAADHVTPSDQRVSVTSSGDARAQAGPDDAGKLRATEAELRFTVDQRKT